MKDNVKILKFERKHEKIERFKDKPNSMGRIDFDILCKNTFWVFPTVTLIMMFYMWFFETHIERLPSSQRMLIHGFFYGFLPFLLLYIWSYKVFFNTSRCKWDGKEFVLSKKDKKYIDLTSKGVGVAELVMLLVTIIGPLFITCAPHAARIAFTYQFFFCLVYAAAHIVLHFLTYVCNIHPNPVPIIILALVIMFGFMRWTGTLRMMMEDVSILVFTFVVVAGFGCTEFVYDINSK